MPRLSIFRSLKHIYAQIIDDGKGRTLVAASSHDLKNGDEKSEKDVCEQVGLLIAEKALKKNISRVVFDRGGCKYHGRIKSLAEGAKKGGLKF